MPGGRPRKALGYYERRAAEIAAAREVKRKEREAFKKKQAENKAWCAEQDKKDKLREREKKKKATAERKEREKARARRRREKVREAKLAAKEELRVQNKEKLRLARSARWYERRKVKQIAALRKWNAENPDGKVQSAFTSPLFDHRVKLSAVYEDNYLDYCIYAAPLLYETADAPLFAELFVAIEVMVGTWAAFLHFGIIDDELFTKLTRTHENQARFIRRRTTQYIEKTKEYGYPLVSEYQNRRAHWRYKKICERLGATWSLDEQYNETGLAHLGLVLRANPTIRNHIPASRDYIDRCEAIGIYAGDRGEPRNRACPAALGDHGHRSCILCALTLSKKAFDDGPEHYRFSFNVKSSREQRLARCCQYLLSDGPGQHQGALLHWFQADLKRQSDQSAKEGRRVSSREANFGRRTTEKQRLVGGQW